MTDHLSPADKAAIRRGEDIYSGKEKSVDVDTTCTTTSLGPCARCGAELSLWPDGKITSRPSLSRWCGDDHDGHSPSKSIHIKEGNRP